ncbi:hypothetical protein VD0002_g9262 [Verticillium dahliae]|uniref:Uncharacterized protein n=1 Tax=Verticillium dahliae TaxID=27337 RepID=A0AA44WQK3_VERDA|nr:hypothetical protein BJF96_g1566 [Verticillium dahliae]PNH43495.1 hypothetical protein VD0003_g9606 [Verticillium dahliae]PNH58258.1 hypothetical protein VD0002_g9262 [Verticillium dahliae]
MQQNKKKQSRKKQSRKKQEKRETSPPSTRAPEPTIHVTFLAADMAWTFVSPRRVPTNDCTTPART